MTIDSNRLLLELEKLRKEINRNVINPVIPALSIDALQPMLSMIAQCRKDYPCCLLDIAEHSDGQPPAEEQIARLRACRETYDELVSAANALETAIQRDYLDVRVSRR